MASEVRPRRLGREVAGCANVCAPALIIPFGRGAETAGPVGRRPMLKVPLQQPGAAITVYEQPPRPYLPDPAQYPALAST